MCDQDWADGDTGSIINVSSNAAQKPSMNAAVYGAAKLGLNYFTELFAEVRLLRLPICHRQSTIEWHVDDVNIGVRSKRALQLYSARSVLNGHCQGMGCARNDSELEADLSVDACWRSRRGCWRRIVRE